MTKADDPVRQREAPSPAMDGHPIHRLTPQQYDMLRAIAGRLFRHERKGHTLDPTEVVNEALAKLATQADLHCESAEHFQAIAARAMRQVLVDHAAARNTLKRGAGWRRITIQWLRNRADAKPVDLLALNEALEELSSFDARLARVVEMRVFAGMSTAEIAQVEGCNQRTIQRVWKEGKRLLYAALGPDD